MGFSHLIQREYGVNLDAKLSVVDERGEFPEGRALKVAQHIARNESRADGGARLPHHAPCRPGLSFAYRLREKSLSKD